MLLTSALACGFNLAATYQVTETSHLRYVKSSTIDGCSAENLVIFQNNIFQTRIIKLNKINLIHWQFIILAVRPGTDWPPVVGDCCVTKLLFLKLSSHRPLHLILVCSSSSCLCIADADKIPGRPRFSPSSPPHLPLRSRFPCIVFLLQWALADSTWELRLISAVFQTGRTALLLCPFSGRGEDGQRQSNKSGPSLKTITATLSFQRSMICTYRTTPFQPHTLAWKDGAEHSVLVGQN